MWADEAEASRARAVAALPRDSDGASKRIRIRPYTDILNTQTRTHKYTLQTGSHSFDTAQPLPPFLTRDERHDDDEDRPSSAVLRNHSGGSKLQRSALLLGRRGAVGRAERWGPGR